MQEMQYYEVQIYGGIRNYGTRVSSIEEAIKVLANSKKITDVVHSRLSSDLCHHHFQLIENKSELKQILDLYEFRDLEVVLMGATTFVNANHVADDTLIGKYSAKIKVSRKIQIPEIKIPGQPYSAPSHTKETLIESLELQVNIHFSVEKVVIKLNQDFMDY